MSRSAAPSTRVLLLAPSDKAGLTDRALIFTWLLRLGEALDASTAVLGSPSEWLATLHSDVVASAWSDYFMAAEPFADHHEAAVHDRCERVADCNALGRMFTSLAAATAGWCANLTFSPIHVQTSCPGNMSQASLLLLSRARTSLTHTSDWPRPVLPRCLLFSSAVLGAYGAARAGLRLPPVYGFAHVRRHDKRRENAACTGATVIANRIAGCNREADQRSSELYDVYPPWPWVVAVYETPRELPAYLAELRRAAANASVARLILEDELLRSLNTSDNSVRFAVLQLFMRDAAQAIGTHFCHSGAASGCHQLPQLLEAMMSDGERSCAQLDGSVPHGLREGQIQRAPKTRYFVRAHARWGH